MQGSIILIMPNNNTLLTAAKVMYPANSTMRFAWLTHSTSIFIVEERSNIYILLLKIYKIKHLPLIPLLVYFDSIVVGQ